MNESTRAVLLALAASLIARPESNGWTPFGLIQSTVNEGRKKPWTKTPIRRALFHLSLCGMVVADHRRPCRWRLTARGVEAAAKESGRVR